VIQTEAERQFYLEMSGIRMWYARNPLPGAAPSPDYDFGVQEAEVAVVPRLTVPVAPAARQPDPEKASRNRDKIARLQSLMAPAPKNAATVTPVPEKTEPQAPPPEEPEVQPEVSDTAPEADVASVPRLSLQAWVGSRVVLVGQLSEDSSFALQESLAQNILRSLGEQGVKASGVLHWPLFNNLKVSLNGPEHLAVALKALFQNVASQKVVVLGESGDWLAAGLGREPDVVFETSLATLATDPDRKRLLWQLIKPLRA